MVKKAKIEDAIYDVLTEEEYRRNESFYQGYTPMIAIEKDGYLLPIRTKSDTRPGFYPGENIGDDGMFILPGSTQQNEYYRNCPIINFSEAKTFKDLIQAQDKLNKAEYSILTTPDNITIPVIGPNDTPFLQAIKQAIIDKNIDLDKYGPRFGANYPNEKRLLKKPDMTLQKGILYAQCLDFDIFVTLKDKSPDVPNPIGETITVKLTGEGSGFISSTEEIEEAAYPIPSCELKETYYPIKFFKPNQDPNCPIKFFGGY